MEIKPFFIEKNEILKNVAVKLGCHGNVDVPVHVTTTLKCSQIILGKFAKFGVHSFNGFEVI